jgi:hypothetical protein
MTDRPKVCIDRLTPRELLQFQPTRRRRDGNFEAIAPIGKTWMNGSKLRVRFLGGTPPSRTRRQQAKWWTQVANLGWSSGTTRMRRSASRSIPTTGVVLHRHRLQRHSPERADDESGFSRRRDRGS